MTYKIFLNNPYLKEIRANIVDKTYKNNRYFLKLDKTIFYPHLSGGQPRDRGTINGVQVLDVFEDGESIIHVTNKDIKDNKANLKIEWENRFDLMQQHSGQHLLSSSFYRLFNIDTLGFHIGRDYIYIDIKKTDLNIEEVKQVEYLSNKIIHSNFKIKTYFPPKDKLSTLPLRKKPPRAENIRLVEIDKIDYTPCCGTHLSFTGEIGLIKIRKWERYKGNTRVEFVCGNRALKDYDWKSQYINKISQKLSSKDRDILRKINVIVDQKEKLNKENRRLREDLYKYKGELYYRDVKNNNGINYIIKYIKDVDLKEVGFISSYLNDKSKLIQVYGVKNGDMGQLLVSRSQDLDIDLKRIFNDACQNTKLRGGGSPQLIQGGTSITNLSNVIKMFCDKIKNYYKG